MREQIDLMIKNLDKFLKQEKDIKLQAMILNAKLELKKIKNYEKEV